MRITYDKKIDAAYLHLVDSVGSGQVSKTISVDPREIDGEINLDFDSDGHLMGIEIQEASRFLSGDLLANIPNLGNGSEMESRSS
jgi:uncharacterized protein YuzE